MGFVSDSLTSGSPIKFLTVADDFRNECVQIGADCGISGEYITRFRGETARFRGYPGAVRTDNGPELTSRASVAWAQGQCIRHILIEPERPMQNGYIGSFNGKFRDQCLGEHWFQTLPQGTRTRRNGAARLQRSPTSKRARPSSPRHGLRKTNYPTASSINLSTPDFLRSTGTEEVGRSGCASALRRVTCVPTP